jgi:hypothetical protein
MVPRHPVKAAKDPNAHKRMSARDSADWTGALARLNVTEAETFVALTRALCPHDWLADTPYRTVALSLDQEATADDRILAILRQGLASLARVFGIPFGNLSAGNQIIALRSCEREPFFAHILQHTLRVIYDDPLVWAGCGYEGVHGASETETRAGYNDLAWLPEPTGDRD